MSKKTIRKIPKKYTARLSRRDKSKQKKNLIGSRKLYKPVTKMINHHLVCIYDSFDCIHLLLN